jgi:hypothetical protein
MWRILVLALSLFAVGFAATFILVLFSENRKVTQLVVEAQDLSVSGSMLTLNPSKVTTYTHNHQLFRPITTSTKVSPHTLRGLFTDITSLVNNLRAQGDLFAVLIIPSHSVQVSMSIDTLEYVEAETSFLAVDFSYLEDDEQVRLHETLEVDQFSKCQKLSRSVLQDEAFTAQHGILLIGHSSLTSRF